MKHKKAHRSCKCKSGKTGTLAHFKASRGKKAKDVCFCKTRRK